ncbi:MAG: NTP transferase domain-containing protein [Opitutaceae bacterium]|nr:NTP transferase domain-containing protein [Opitutaceae bacterium]
MQIAALYLSPGHNFFGHHGQPPGEHPMLAVDAVACVAGRGLQGDRFLDYRPDYAGQITFFAEEVHRGVLAALRPPPRAPTVYRRNALTRGVDLATLYGKEFVVQGVRFLGAGECKPCYWMDQAVGPGAEAWLRGRGGLRARILTDGPLRVDCPVAAGLLLAGGRSSRMGRDKAALDWRGRPLGEHQAATLAASGAWPLRLSCRPEQGWTPAGFARLEDGSPDGGALAALCGAVATAPAEVTAVLAVDLPFVTPALLEKITGRAREARAAVVPRVDGRFQPFAAAWHRSAQPELQAGLAAGRPLQEICARLHAAGRLRAYLPEPAEAAAFANLNTPADLARGAALA